MGEKLKSVLKSVSQNFENKKISLKNEYQP